MKEKNFWRILERYKKMFANQIYVIFFLMTLLSQLIKLSLLRIDLYL